MNVQKRNICVPGSGFVFTPDGLDIKDMAVKLHKAGYLTDEEIANDGGAAALRRKLYDEIFQNRRHYSKFRKPLSELTEKEKEDQVQEEKLALEMNSYADALGVNDPKYMDMIIAKEDLEAFRIQVSGKNMVDAELVAKAMTNDPLAIEKINNPPSREMVLILEMVRWVLAGRPEV